MKLITWQAEDFLHRLDDVVDVYGTAMNYGPSMLDSRRGFMASHVHRGGFRAVATIGDDGELAGFGYGYTSLDGQWWHDQVRAGLRRDMRRIWLTDCFEIVELHVRPSAQGNGIGAGQLQLLMDLAPGSRALLSTPEADERLSRAWRLYRRFGFTDLLRQFYFPGDQRPFAILGRDLPQR